MPLFARSAPESAMDSLNRFCQLRRQSALRALSIVVGAAFLATTPVSARDPKAAVADARDEVAAELAECAAYYVISARVIKNSAVAPDVAERVSKQSLDSGEMALAASTELTSELVATTRMNADMQALMRQLQGGTSFSSIMSKHNYPCKERIEHPEERMKYWVGEKSKLPDPPK